MNNKILKNRWKAVDKLLSAHFNDIKVITRELKDEIQNIFNRTNLSYDELINYADITTMSFFKRVANNFLENDGISEYSRFLINKYKNRKKLKNKDILLALLIIAYEYKQIKLNEAESELFQRVCEGSYTQGQLEAKKDKVYPFPNSLLLLLLSMPAYQGYVWKDYSEGNVVYNAKQIYTQVILNIQQGKELNVEADEFDVIFQKQDRRYLNKKSDGRVDKYSGSLDNYTTFLANQTALEGMKKQGVEKVRFVAVTDKKTTDMCKSLDGQIFSIDGLNVYSRYSKEDDGNIIYETQGLQVGANLPPITNGYHHCRSTIYPERN